MPSILRISVQSIAACNQVRAGWITRQMFILMNLFWLGHDTHASWSEPHSLDVSRVLRECMAV